MTDQDALANDPPLPAHFSTSDFRSPGEALARFRELTASICDVIVHGDIKDFTASSTTYQLSGALLIDARTSAPRYDRTEKHVAYGLDHIHVVMYLGGGAEFIAQGRSYVQHAGDVGLIDMGRPTVTREIQAEDGVCHVVSFLTPRLLLAPLLKTEPNGPTVRILRQEAPYGALLRDYLLALRRSAPHLTQSESQSAVQAMAQLTIGAFSHLKHDASRGEDPSRDDLRERVRLHVEDNLGVSSLGVESLCGEFGLSRTGLYRLFAPQSPIHYIQQRRLQRALAMLLSPAFRNWRILDIALECNFSSDATFARAFRSAFGYSPGEARKRAGEKVPGLPVRSDRPELQPDAAAIHWISQLTGAMLPTPSL